MKLRSSKSTAKPGGLYHPVIALLPTLAIGILLPASSTVSPAYAQEPGGPRSTTPASDIITILLPPVPPQPSWSGGDARPRLAWAEVVRARVRTVGVEGDQAHIALVREALNLKPFSTAPGMRVIADSLRTLAQLGATEALPDIEKVMNEPYLKDYERDYARIAHARLIAEADDNAKRLSLKRAAARSAPQEAEQQRVSIKLDRFLAEADISPARLSQATEIQRQSSNGSWGYSLIALRELADMIYQKRDVELAKEAKSRGIDFDSDPASALKIELAPLSREQRVTTLIDKLLHKKALTETDDYIIQLAIDEGTLASNAAAEKLRYILEHRNQFMDLPEDRLPIAHVPISALFRVIRGVGDTKQAPVVEQFLKDRDKWVVSYAVQNLPDIKSGTPHVRVSPY